MNFPTSGGFFYVIGNNGSGKSRLLQNHAESMSEVREVIVIATGASDKFRFRSQIRKTAKGSYRYLGNRTVGNGTHNGTLFANAVLLYLDVLEKGLEKNFKEFLSEIGFDEKISIAYRKTKFSKYKSFETQELDKSFGVNYSQYLSAKEKPFEAVFYKNKEEYALSDLSSGEQYIITTALKIVASINSNACFFIDEPEVSLHVEWQVKWPERFQKLLELRPNVQAYIATHSPIIISSALKTNASCFTLENGGLSKITEQDFNVERILFREFNTLTPNNKFVFEELANIVSSTVENLSGSMSLTQASRMADDCVRELKTKVLAISRAESDNDFIQHTLRDFESAIKELIALPHGGEEIVTALDQ